VVNFPHIRALPDNKGKLTAIGGVLLVHVFLIAIILSGIPKIIGVRESTRELFFVFAPKPHERLPPAAPTPSIRAPIFRNRLVLPKAGTAPSPQIDGLRLSTTRCAPETLANLSPEERDRCSSAWTALSPSPSDAIPGTVREHAVDAGTWRASIARRNSAIRVPCSYTRAIPEDITTGRTAKAIMVDPLCALGLTKGSYH
jgi:hypothetical protein